MRDEDSVTIRELPLFSKMDEHHFGQLMPAAYAQRFPPHVDLIREGEPADFYLLQPLEKTGQPQVVTLPYGKKNLASILGMTPESLSRAFGALQAHGIIMDGARVEIHDRESLALFSKLNPFIDDPHS